MHGANAAAVDALCSLGHLVVNVTGLEHGKGLIRPWLGGESAGNSILAVAENLAVASIHSK